MNSPRKSPERTLHGGLVASCCNHHPKSNGQNPSSPGWSGVGVMRYSDVLFSQVQYRRLTSGKRFEFTKYPLNGINTLRVVSADLFHRMTRWHDFQAPHMQQAHRGTDLQAATSQKLGTRQSGLRFLLRFPATRVVVSIRTLQSAKCSQAA